VANRDLYIKTLQRAAALAGSEFELALRLKVTPSHLRLWLAGTEPPPTHAFLRAVDVLSELTETARDKPAR